MSASLTDGTYTSAGYTKTKLAPTSHSFLLNHIVKRDIQYHSSPKPFFAMKMTMKLWISVAIAAIANSLDVELEEMSCDGSLPVQAKFYLRCNDSSRCTFGETALIYGTLTYTDELEESGIENDVAYITSDLSFWTLDFNLFDMMEVPLCHESMVADEGNEADCPGAGSHDFQITYKLPSSGSESTSWLASGWHGSGTIFMYAEPNENMMIGHCTLDLQTYVTPTSADEKSLLGTPSAAVAFGIALGGLVVFSFLCFYCYCCCQKRKKVETDSKAPIDEINVTSSFKRMDDDTRTLQTRQTRLSKAASANKSVSPSVVSELPNP